MSELQETEVKKPEVYITWMGKNINDLNKDDLIKCITHLMEHDKLCRKSYNEHISFLESSILSKKVKY